MKTPEPADLTPERVRRFAPVDAGSGAQFLPFADAATPELPLGACCGCRCSRCRSGMATGAAGRHAEPRDDRRAGRAGLAGGADGGAAAAVRAVRALMGFARTPPLGPRLAPRALHLDGHADAVRRLAIMPFALILLSGDTRGPGRGSARPAPALAFLLVGAGMQTTQTAGLALATDLAPSATRPRVVALMYVMLLVGMVGQRPHLACCWPTSAQLRLIQVVQGCAVVTVVLNLCSRCGSRSRATARAVRDRAATAGTRPSFRESWRVHAPAHATLPGGGGPGHRRLQHAGRDPRALRRRDPAHGRRRHHGADRLMAAGRAGGLRAGRALAGPRQRPHRLAALGRWSAWSLSRGDLRRAAAVGQRCSARAAVIGFGGGLFSVGTLTARWAGVGHQALNGLALGAWGAVQATCAGVAMALGGALRDVRLGLATAARWARRWQPRPPATALSTTSN
jgi:BCD family chlorophyll transporter-like MFS transporter